jgi:putative aminopeptidase FrvX
MNAKLGAAAALLVCACSFCFVGTAPGLIVRGDAAYINDLRELVDTPAVSGYETQLSNKIRDELSAFHPTVDNLGDVVVTVGSGAPHRLVAAPIDEPGYVVSDITADGYLRLRRVPLSGLPPIFNEFYSAQPVQVGAAGGKWLNGVVAGLSIHLQPGRVASPDPRDIDNMYVDIGASSASEVRRAGVDVLSPVAIDRKLATLNNAEASAASVGDKFGAAAVMALLQGMGRSKLTGTLTVAFVTQEWSGGRGLHRILATTPCDEFIYVGRMQPNLPTAANPVPQKSPQRHPGSGVLLGFEQTDAAQTGIEADLKQLAATNKIAFDSDYSAVPVDAGYDGPFVFPANWAHIGIATAWPNTPVETIDLSDLRGLIDLLGVHYGIGPQSQRQSTVITSGLAATESSHPTNEEMLRRLVTSYGTSNHEGAVRDAVKKLLPEWAKTETDDAGNLIMRVGTAPAAAKSPKILVVAHTDEIGFEVKSIDADGVLEATATGGMYLSYFLGHPAYIHTQTGICGAIMLPPNGWDQPTFKWRASTNSISEVDVGAHSREEAAALGIKPGDFITIPKEYRTMLGTRAIGRSFDDRVGDTALVSAVWALGAPLKDRDVTFVWSTGEELGLDGARALAKRLAAENREPDYVFAVDTFVSSDSPLESERFGDAQIGKGFVIRALDGSNVVPQKDVDRLVRLARANQIPVQYGVTGGGNDGSEFVPYGSIDVAIAWPLRYAHSPGEVIDTRDVDSLARIVAVVAKDW